MTSSSRHEKVVLTGAAGLLGQNLIAHLTAGGYTNLVAIDKHPENTRILRQQHPHLDVRERDLTSADDTDDCLDGCHVLVVGHAQIGGLREADFIDNNLKATEKLLTAAKRSGVEYIVHISSSVVNSAAVDFYTETKKMQERLYDQLAIPHVVLRPTLMFGWFDRKHLGWLARFMARAPIFPIPGSGRYLRQPLYIGDFCKIIIAAIERRTVGTFNISGQERLDYIDLIQAVKSATNSKARIQAIPYRLFWMLLAAYSYLDKDPPFTTKQLEALVTPDLFEVIDWPGIFGIRPTPLRMALEETFRHPVHSKVVLSF